MSAWLFVGAVLATARVWSATTVNKPGEAAVGETSPLKVVQAADVAPALVMRA
jgi:hypothetical protein